MNKWHWFVYIIECLDSSYYTGMTWNIGDRMDQHISRLGSKYTGRHGFKKLAYYEEFDDIENARNREKQIKNWSQEKKNKLISGEWKKSGSFSTSSKYIQLIIWGLNEINYWPRKPWRKIYKHAS